MVKIGIIGAMDVEVGTLCSMLQNIKTIQIAGLTFYTGYFEKTPSVIVKSGIGKVNAALCTQILVSVFSVTKIINTGIAGAIDTRLDIFDIVVSTEAGYHDVDVTGFGYPDCTIPGMKTFFTADTTLVEIARNAYTTGNYIGKIMAGRIVSGDAFIASDDKKHLIRDKCNPLCVEMEGAAVAHTCSVNEVPFLVIRCISDNADETVEHSYSFNEEKAADISAHLVHDILQALS